MSFAVAVAQPTRMTIGNLRTGETQEVFFNPTELQKQLSVNWTRQRVPGLPHEPLQYQNTSNLQVTLELYCQATDRAEDADLIDDFERFLMSLCYPSASADSIATGAPPRVLVVWPNVMSFQAVVAGNVQFRHTQFATDGRSLRYTATLPLEEIRDFRLTSEDVRRQGTRRAPVGAANSEES